LCLNGGHVAAYQDLLCIADAPREISSVTVGLNNFRGEFDAEPATRWSVDAETWRAPGHKHLMHSKYDALGELAVSLDKTPKAFFWTGWRDFGIPVKAVLDHWQEGLLGRAMDRAIGVNLDIIFIEARDSNLKGLGERHDMVFAAVVVPKLEDAGRPP
jgi:hypothetical protein